MKKRICFRCGQEISFSNFKCHKPKSFSVLQMRDIWDSPYIQLFCCKCFGKVRKERKEYQWILDHRFFPERYEKITKWL